MSDDRAIVAQVGGRDVRFVLPIQPVLVRQLEAYRRVIAGIEAADAVALQVLPLGLWWDGEPLGIDPVATTRAQWRDLDRDTALDYSEAVWTNLAEAGFSSGQIAGMASALLKAAGDSLKAASEVAATVGFGSRREAGGSSAE